MGGVGGTPGYYERGELTNSFETYWAAAPLTLPFAKGKVLWDLMPGLSVDLGYDLELVRDRPALDVNGQPGTGLLPTSYTRHMVGAGISVAWRLICACWASIRGIGTTPMMRNWRRLQKKNTGFY